MESSCAYNLDVCKKFKGMNLEVYLFAFPLCLFDWQAPGLYGCVLVCDGFPLVVERSWRIKIVNIFKLYFSETEKCDICILKEKVLSEFLNVCDLWWASFTCWKAYATFCFFAVSELDCGVLGRLQDYPLIFVEVLWCRGNFSLQRSINSISRHSHVSNILMPFILEDMGSQLSTEPVGNVEGTQNTLLACIKNRRKKNLISMRVPPVCLWIRILSFVLEGGLKLMLGNEEFQVNF